MIYTFYSYKGGVGRSMALANVAEWLYLQGLRVVIIDWDLEAPGLENFFYRSPEDLELVRSQLGLIDMLMAYKRLFPRLALPSGQPHPISPSRSNEEEFHKILEVLQQKLPPIVDSLYPIHAPETTNGRHSPALWLLPAGWRARDRFPVYAQAVQNFDWADFYASYHGEIYFEWLRRQLVAEELADVVLIDSRTGVTEMGGVCTRQMADVVVSFCVPNVQNLSGVETMVRSFTREEIIHKRERELTVVVVPTRIDVSELDARNRFEKEFHLRLAQFTPPIFRTVHSTFWDLLIQYIPKYAYVERLAINDPDSARELEDAYKRLTAHLVLLARGQSGLRMRKHYAPELQRIFGPLLPSAVLVSSGSIGMQLAQTLRTRLVEHGIMLSAPPVDLTDSRNDWQQIKASLEPSKFLLILMTPDTMESEAIRQEWRSARQQGICVHLVTQGPLSHNTNGSNLPRWLQNVRCYDLDRDWETLVHHLQSPCQAPRVPFMAPPLSESYVARPELLNQLKRTTLETTRVGLWGPAGSGKRVLAAALCQDEEIITHFNDGLLWSNLGIMPPIQGELTAVYTTLTGEHLTFSNEDEAVGRLREKLAERNFLWVIDDVWDARHLQPFLHAGKKCTFVITTRDANVVSALEAKLFVVDETTPAEALRILTTQLDLSSSESALCQGLIQHLGRWPLVLKLANVELRKRIAQGASAVDAILSLKRTLDQQGVLALDQPNALNPNEALTTTIAPSLNQLPEDERGRYLQLAFFPTETDIPLRAVCERWGMHEIDTEKRLQRFADLSLLAYDLNAKTVRLHSALRSYSLHQSEIQANPDALLEAALARLSPAEQKQARQVLTRLVRVSSPQEGGRDVPIPVKLSELSPAAQKVVHRLVEDRLVVREQDSTGGDMVRLVRETFLRDSKRLRSWLDEDREFLFWRQQLSTYMTDWVNTARDPGAFLIGAPLSIALAWKEKKAEELNATELAYITASRQSERKKQRVLFALVTTILLLLLAGIVSLTRQSRQVPQEGSPLPAPAPPTTPFAEVEKQKIEEAAVYVLEANKYIQRGVTDLAFLNYTRALELNPDFAEAYLGRGTLYDQQGDFDRAIEDYNKAIARKKDFADAYLNRGISFTHKGDSQKALADYDRAITLAPDNPIAYVNRGRERENNKQIDLAIADYSKAIELKDDYAEAYFNRAAAYQQKGVKEKAVADFQHILTLNTDAQTVQAVQARLAKLGVTTTPLREPLSQKVYLHYNDANDEPTLQAVAKSLAGKGVHVQGTERRPDRTEGDVRYFYKEDEAAAVEIKKLVELSLAREGVKSSLDLLSLEAAKFPNAKPGNIEVWIPSLSRRLPTRRLEPRAGF